MTTCKEVLCAFLAIVFALAVGFTMDIAAETHLLAKKSRFIDVSSANEPPFSAIQNDLKEDVFLCRKS